MEGERPLVRDSYPNLITELVSLLESEGEHALATCAKDLRLVGECQCGDDFCRSIHTAEHPRGQPYGSGHRCLPLAPSQGMLILDIVDGRIMYIEVLHRATLT
ncbi:hypothetical protein [Amycolatopsis sp. NPDC059657]|uniref:hypothetical protein n=1 Tax=Amycolatopsis sp. NPDC059657 TaxID=3346899 RepID=UPI00366E3AFF